MIMRDGIEIGTVAIAILVLGVSAAPASPKPEGDRPVKTERH